MIYERWWERDANNFPMEQFLLEKASTKCVDTYDNP
jgi:hypothetical protein